MKFVLYTLVLVSALVSCQHEDQKSEYEATLHRIGKSFSSIGLSSPDEISKYFKNRDFVQIPCIESTYIISENFKAPGIETLIFIQRENGLIGVVLVQLEPVPITALTYCFSEDLGYKSTGEDIAIVNRYKHEDAINTVISFRINNVLYSEGSSTPITR